MFSFFFAGGGGGGGGGRWLEKNRNTLTCGLDDVTQNGGPDVAVPLSTDLPLSLWLTISHNIVQMWLIPNQSKHKSAQRLTKQYLNPVIQLSNN